MLDYAAIKIKFYPGGLQMLCSIDSNPFGRLLFSAGLGLFLVAQPAIAGDPPPAPPSEANATGDLYSNIFRFATLGLVIFFSLRKVRKDKNLSLKGKLWLNNYETNSIKTAYL